MFNYCSIYRYNDDRIRFIGTSTSHTSCSLNVLNCDIDNIKYTCIFRTEKNYVYEIEVSINIFLYFLTMYLYSRICIVYSSTNPWYIVLILQCRVFTKFLNLNTKRQLKPFYIFLEFPLQAAGAPYKRFVLAA
jgi:hypothetical protein